MCVSWLGEVSRKAHNGKLVKDDLADLLAEVQITEESERVAEGKRLDVVSQASLERMMREASFKPVGGGFVSGGSEVGDERTSQRAQVDAEKNDALEGQRADDDVFRAVFGGEDNE